jgi:hypothetical protein
MAIETKLRNALGAVEQAERKLKPARGTEDEYAATQIRRAIRELREAKQEIERAIRELR